MLFKPPWGRPSKEPNWGQLAKSRPSCGRPQFDCTVRTGGNSPPPKVALGLHFGAWCCGFGFPAQEDHHREIRLLPGLDRAGAKPIDGGRNHEGVGVFACLPVVRSSEGHHAGTSGTASVRWVATPCSASHGPSEPIASSMLSSLSEADRTEMETAPSPKTASMRSCAMPMLAAAQRQGRADGGEP